MAETWTFSTSGWLFVYFFGVIKALRSIDITKDVYVIGSSGGACAGSLLFVDVDPDAMVNFICDCATDARQHWRNAFKIREYVEGAVARFCPPDIAEKVSGRMEISVTKLWGFRNLRLKQFASRQEYVDAILASSCVVGLAGLPYYTRAHGYLIDGGYSDFEILRSVALGTKFCKFHNGNVTSVCPFYCSRADIKPSRYVPVWWALYPPDARQLHDVYKLGIHDTLMFLRKRGQLRVTTAVNMMWQYSLAKPIEERLRRLRNEAARASASTTFPSSCPSTLLRVAPEADGRGAAAPSPHCACAGVASEHCGGMRRHDSAIDINGSDRLVSSSAAECSDAGSAGELEEIEVHWQSRLVEGMETLAKHAHRRLEEGPPRRGLSGLALLYLRSCAWSLVYLELCMQTQLCTLMITATPLLLLLLPSAEWARAWNRLCFCWQSMFNVRLLMKTLPVVGSGVQMHGNTPFELQLAQMSFAYRFLFYLL